MMRRIIKRDVATDRTTHNHGFLEFQRFDKRMHEFRVRMDGSMLLPVHRIRARVPRQVKRKSMKPLGGEQRHQVLVFE